MYYAQIVKKERGEFSRASDLSAQKLPGSVSYQNVRYRYNRACFLYVVSLSDVGAVRIGTDVEPE